MARKDRGRRNGRGASLTPRDGQILQDLFFCRYLSTTQLAALRFNSKSAARRRLVQLQEQGLIEARNLYISMPEWRTFGKCENVYHLSKEGFGTVTESLKLYDEAYVSKQLGPDGAVHHVKTAQVFVSAIADLDEILGPYPEWVWEHEKKAEDSFEFSAKPLGHQPDAHILFAGHTFIVERQTGESHITLKGVDDKIGGHALWAEARTENPEKVEVLFACDQTSVAQQAERAGKRYGIEVVGGTVEEVAYYLYQSAMRLGPQSANGSASQRYALPNDPN